MTVDTHFRLKPSNDDLLTRLCDAYRVTSKNAALNRLLDDLRNGRVPQLHPQAK